MAEVATCPRCGGEKRIRNAQSGESEPCSTCNGDGVVWRDTPTEQAADRLDQSTPDHLDLTFRR